MKNKIMMLFLFIFLVPGPLGAQPKVPQTRWQVIKNRFDKELGEFKKCVRRDKNCDALRKKLYITTAIVLAVLVGAGATKAYKYSKRVPEPRLEDRDRREEIGWLEKENKEKAELVKADWQKKLQADKLKIEQEREKLKKKPTEIKLGTWNPEDESEGEEIYEDADEEGYESAEEENLSQAPQQPQEQDVMMKVAENEKLKKTIVSYERTYTQTYNNLNSAIRVPHSGGKLLPAQYAKETQDVQARQKAGEEFYTAAIYENDSQKKLDLLKKALNKLRGA